MTTPSAIIEPFVHVDDGSDDDLIEAMTLAAVEAGDPEAFDRIINGNPAMQMALLRWRGHLTLAARAFYRQATQAYDSMVEHNGEIAPGRRS
jgi:hypothetical protein